MNTLVEEPSSFARGEIVRALARARSLGARAALPALIRQIRSVSGVIDRVALLLLKAEILFLDNQLERSGQVFDEEISSLEPDMGEDLRTAIAENRTLVGLRMLAAGSDRDHYMNVDARRSRREPLWDAEAILDADEAAEAGRSFESLPVYWRELRRAYVRRQWRQFMLASERMARQCIRLHLPSEALYHAASAQDDKLTKHFVRALGESCNSSTAIACANTGMVTCNLTAHAGVFCEVLIHLADYLPPDVASRCINWLSKLLATVPTRWHESSLCDNAWRAAAALAPVIPKENAERLLKMTTEHALWRARSIQREHLIEVTSRCARRLPRKDARVIAGRAVPLVTDTADDRDYLRALRLLRTLAERGGSRTRMDIRRALYRPGAGLTAPLIESAEFFGHKLRDLPRLVSDVVEAIKLQVEHVDHDEEVRAVPDTLFVHTNPNGPKKIVVRATAGARISAVLAHRTKLPSEAVRLLGNTALRMLQHKDNFPRNKLILVNMLAALTEVASPTLQGRVFAAIRAFASKASDYPASAPDLRQAKNPLNPFRIGDVEPSAVRAAAVVALPRVVLQSRRRQTKAVDRVICAAVYAPDSSIRQAGLIAAGESQRLPAGMLPALLLATRDADSGTRATAFSVLAGARDLRLKPNEWDLLIVALRLGAQSDDRVTRTSVARSVLNVSTSAPRAHADDLKMLRAALSSDPAFSVRRILTKNMR